jgi:hypothetical protein
VRALDVVAEDPTRLETRLGVKRTSGRKGGHRPRFKADLPDASLAGGLEEVEKHCLPDAAPTRGFGRVHRFQLGVIAIESLQRANGDEPALVARAKEGQGRVESVVRPERVDVLGRGVLLTKGEVPVE